MAIAAAGVLAFYDSFAGLVPCKITSAFRLADGSISITAVATAKRGAYERGQHLGWDELPSARLFVPRDAVYRSRQACGQYRIRPYSWELPA